MPPEGQIVKGQNAPVPMQNPSGKPGQPVPGAGEFVQPGWEVSGQMQMPGAGKQGYPGQEASVQPVPGAEKSVQPGQGVPVQPVPGAAKSEQPVQPAAGVFGQNPSGMPVQSQVFGQNPSAQPEQGVSGQPLMPGAGMPVQHPPVQNMVSGEVSGWMSQKQNADVPGQQPVIQNQISANPNQMPVNGRVPEQNQMSGNDQNQKPVNGQQIPAGSQNPSDWEQRLWKQNEQKEDERK